MSITPFPYGETVTVSRPGGFDTNGDPLPGADHLISGCVVYPSSMDESAAGTTVDGDYTLLGPYGADLNGSDTIFLEADTSRTQPLYVKGLTWQVKHPMNGWTPGCQAYLKLNQGGLS